MKKILTVLAIVFVCETDNLFAQNLYIKFDSTQTIESPVTKWHHKFIDHLAFTETGRRLENYYWIAYGPEKDRIFLKRLYTVDRTKYTLVDASEIGNYPNAMDIEQIGALLQPLQEMDRQMWWYDFEKIFIIELKQPNGKIKITEVKAQDEP